MIQTKHAGEKLSPHRPGGLGARSAGREAGWRAGVAAFALLCAAFAAGQAHAVNCDDFDECTQNDMCQADGECVGTPRPNGTACDDGNPCTQNDTCQAGRCTGGASSPDGTPCTTPGLETCEAECVTIPFVNITQCVPTHAECMDDNFCTFECFNKQTKRCEVVFTNDCSYPCATGQCDPESGECQTAVGAVCDDFNPCTSNDRCTEQGFCQGSAGPGGTATRTPTGVAATRTPTGIPSTATRTPTRPETATATRTKTPKPTPLPGPCLGDCDEDGRVEINELVSGIEMALGRLAVTSCFDLNGDGHVMVDELISAIGAAVYGCVSGTPPPTVTPGAQTATPTPTPSPTATTSPGGSIVPQRAAGTIQATSTAFLAVPNAIAALLTSVSSILGGAGGAGLFDIPFNCPIDGGGTVGCDMQLFPPGPPTYTVVIDGC